MKKKWIQQELFLLSYREVAYKALAAWVAREMDREVMDTLCDEEEAADI